MKVPSSSVVEELIDDLEREVNNGGFDQFFFNSAGDRTSQILVALRAIGAMHTAAIVESACAKFPGGIPPTDRNARQELLSSVSPETEGFEAEDEQFFAYKDDLAALVSAYRGGG